jgi:hypothetical protein
MQPFIEDSAVEARGAPPVQYVHRNPNRTRLLALGLVVFAGALVWITLGRPTRSTGDSPEVHAPPPVGAPLRAPRMPETANQPPAPAPAATATPAPADVPLKLELDGDYAHVSFEALAGFEYDPYLLLDAPSDDGKPPEQIPPAVKALNGRKIAVEGFMVPVQMVKEDVRYFLLVRNQMLCCFGVAVGMNEWIYITMAEGTHARYVPDVPVMVYGTLKVGEEIRDGIVMSIYRMDGDKLVVKGGF